MHGLSSNTFHCTKMYTLLSQLPLVYVLLVLSTLSRGSKQSKNAVSV